MKFKTRGSLRPLVLVSGVTLGCILSGCGPSIPQLRATAAQDFSCPESELELARVDGDTMHVSGCAYESTYTSTCEKGQGCEWQRDEEVKDQTEVLNEAR